VTPKFLRVRKKILDHRSEESPSAAAKLLVLGTTPPFEDVCLGGEGRV